MKKPIQDTIEFVRQVFAGQLDKAGQPVHEHSERVYQHLIKRWPNATEDEQHAALLHDVIEDTPTTLADLKGMGYSDETIEIVSWVTHVTYDPQARETYQGYVYRIANEGPIGAVKVKLADNQDNRTRDHSGFSEEKIASFQKKYAKARATLEEAYAKRTRDIDVLAA